MGPSAAGGETVDLKAKRGQIVLEPIRRRPRDGWDRAAREMHEAGDDVLLIPDVFEDDVEVEWK